MKRYYVYVIKNKDRCKVGVSGDPSRRLKQLQTSNPDKLTLASSVLMSSKQQAYYIESYIHDKFKRYKIRGEWFKNIDPSVFSDNIRKIKVKHDSNVEYKRKSYQEDILKEVGKDNLEGFLDEMKGKGATQFSVDISDYGLESTPLCLYASKGSGGKKSKVRQFLGAICKAGVFRIKQDSVFSSKGRKFFILDY